MKPNNRLHPFLLTIPALLALACDAPEAETEIIEDTSQEDTPDVTNSRTAAVSAPADDSNPEGYEIDPDDFPPSFRFAAQDEEDERKKDEDEDEEDDKNKDEDKAPEPEPEPASKPGPKPGPGPGPEKGEVLVAMAGDMGSGSKPTAVYQLILAEKADFLIIPGDFDYKHNPKTFKKEIDDVLGAEFPVFPAIGNHDTKKWKEYQADFKARLAKVPGAVCTGDLGVESACTYRGIHFVLSGIGTKGSDSAHEQHIAEALAADASPWSLCVWHKNQTDFQAGDKPSDVPWAAFQECQKDGSIVVMAHEHSYARTKTLTAIGSGDHGATGMPDLLEVGPGSTFSVVTGLGGKGARAWEEGVHKGDTWWGTLYASDYWRKNGVEMKKPSADTGALFIRFNVGGDPSAAEGYFKTVDGDVIDEFDIVHK